MRLRDRNPRCPAVFARPSLPPTGGTAARDNMQPVCRAPWNWGVLAFRRDIALKRTNVRGRLLASTMITGAALIAMGGLAHAADAASAGPVQTASGPGAAAMAAAPIQTLTASTDASSSSSTNVTEIVVT